MKSKYTVCSTPPMHSRISYALWCIGVCVLASAGAVSAQSQIALLFPQGLPIIQNSGPSFMLGGAGVGVTDDYNCMLSNPANLGFIDKTVFSSLYLFDMTRIGQGTGHTNFFQGFPQQISIGIPFGAFGAVGLSYNVLSNTAVKFRPSQQAIGFDTSTVTYQSGLAASGGSVAWQVGWGRELPRLKHLRVGVAYERIYYSANTTIVRTISDISTTVESRDSTFDQVRANGLRAGLMLPIDKLKIGISGEYFFRADLQNDNAIYSNSSDTVGYRGSSAAMIPVPVDQKVSTVSLRMPPSLALGASYALTGEWLAAADVASTFWGMYESHGLLATARSNALSICAGAQFVPTPALMAPKYWELLHYSAGLRYTQLPAPQSSEFALSLGAGFPMGKGRGLFTLGVEAGSRTIGTYSNLSENFLHVAVGIDGNRKWNKSGVGNY